MDAPIALLVGAAIAVVLLAAGRRRRRRRLLDRSPDRPEDFAGLWAAGLPLGLSQTEDEHRPEDDTDADLVQLELEEGALDPDELYDDPLVWDEGADDELD